MIEKPGFLSAFQWSDRGDGGQQEPEQQERLGEEPRTMQDFPAP